MARWRSLPPPAQGHCPGAVRAMADNRYNPLPGCPQYLPCPCRSTPQQLPITSLPRPGTDCPASACRCRRCACAGRHQQRRPDAGGHDGLAGDAQRLLEEIPWFAPQARVRLLPDWETLPYDSFSPHHDLVSERLATLYTVMRGDCDILCCRPAPRFTAWRRRPGWRHGPSSSSRANGSTPTR